MTALKATILNTLQVGLGTSKLDCIKLSKLFFRI
jgi:hypothetical protein